MTPYASKRTYAKRKVIVEPVFGWIKQNRSIRMFNRRGIVHCQDEWSLICLTQNLRKVCSRGAMKKLRELILQKKQPIHNCMRLLKPYCISRKCGYAEVLYRVVVQESNATASIFTEKLP